MSSGLEAHILDFVKTLYTAIGWPGVVLLMAIESAGIPVPSEVIMPFAGWFLVLDRGHGLGFVFLAAVLGALGNTIGSIVAYYIGAWGGRPLLERYGRLVLINHHDLDRADAFFQRRGGQAVLISRVLPVVRTFISFPAGIARMPIAPFTALTFAGSFVWSLGLAWAGYALGAHYTRIREVMRPFDYPIGAVILIAIVWFIWRHLRRGSGGASGPAGPGRGDELAPAAPTGSSIGLRSMVKGIQRRNSPRPAAAHPAFNGPHPPTRYNAQQAPHGSSPSPSSAPAPGRVANPIVGDEPSSKTDEGPAN